MDTCQEENHDWRGSPRLAGEAYMIVVLLAALASSLWLKWWSGPLIAGAGLLFIAFGGVWFWGGRTCTRCGKVVMQR
jgi:hypothetical protein